MFLTMCSDETAAELLGHQFKKPLGALNGFLASDWTASELQARSLAYLLILGSSNRTEGKDQQEF